MGFKKKSKPHEGTFWTFVESPLKGRRKKKQGWNVIKRSTEKRMETRKTSRDSWLGVKILACTMFSPFSCTISLQRASYSRARHAMPTNSPPIYTYIVNLRLWTSFQPIVQWTLNTPLYAASSRVRTCIMKFARLTLLEPYSWVLNIVLGQKIIYLTVTLFFVTDKTKWYLFFFARKCIIIDLFGWDVFMVYYLFN